MSTPGRFDDEVGKRVTVGHHYYIIEKVLAEGGYGVVFLVRDGFGRKLALKRIFVNDESKLQDCRTEIDILRRLSGYKNILKYVDSSVVRRHDGVSEVYIITEYYPTTCMQLMEKRGYLTETEVLRIFCDICEAVAILHNCQIPIIHRDIKMENILRDHQHNYVLCDFGSATTRVHEKGDPMRNIRQLEDDYNKHTTKSHRAPEIIDFYTSQTICTKIDIWALGVTLYRLCFNSLPFGESALASQSGHITIPETSTYSEKLHALIYYHFEVNPDLRPDIYQISSVAFQLANKICSVKNSNDLKTPTIDEVIANMHMKQNESRQRKESSSNRVVDRSEWVETTTVQPRERPKAGKALTVPMLSANILHSSNPEIHLSNQSSDAYARQTQPASVDLLGLNSSSHMMSHSLGANLAARNLPANTQANLTSSNPFGDDFGKLAPCQIYQNNGLSSSYNDISNYTTNSLTSGFEDSFTSMSMSAASSAPKKQTFGHAYPAHVKGHNRFGSDPSVMHQQHKSNNTFNLSATTENPYQYTPIQDKQRSSSSNGANNMFDDDFSSLSPTNLSNQEYNTSSYDAPPANTFYQTSHQLDPFGLAPFNPSAI